jgi:TRAP-type C4-dicarboxylate transport system permease large subunit
MHDRAQGSIGIARFFLALITGAILVWLTRYIAPLILGGAKETTDAPKANQATGWLQDFVDYMPILMLLLVFLGLIVFSIYSREVLS